jgi:hypothetical protein
MLLQVQFLENNLESQLDDIRLSKKGQIRFGTPKGAMDSCSESARAIQESIPDVVLDVRYAVSNQLMNGC